MSLETFIYAESRLRLHEKLEAVEGVKKAYFQPPETVKLKYPCIIYSRTAASNLTANDKNYNFRWRYKLTIIDPDPESQIPDIVAREFSYCSFDRSYTADNLNYYVFDLYY